jgi:hypothetical protein
MSVRNAQVALAEARARREAAERGVEETWQDPARRAFCNRIMTPLDRETSQIESAIRQLEQDLARALIALA